MNYSLISAAFSLFVSSYAAALDNRQAPDFPRIETAYFLAKFNERVAAAGSDARPKLKSCTGGDGGRTCTYLFDSVAINLTERDGKNELQDEFVICAKDCQPIDLVIAVGASLYVLAPGLQKSAYGSWVAGATSAIEKGVPFETTIGPVHLTVPRVGGLGILVLLGPENEIRK